jgi:hypothetical protein
MGVDAMEFRGYQFQRGRRCSVERYRSSRELPRLRFNRLVASYRRRHCAASDGRARDKDSQR